MFTSHLPDVISQHGDDSTPGQQPEASHPSEQNNIHDLIWYIYYMDFNIFIHGTKKSEIETVHCTTRQYLNMQHIVQHESVMYLFPVCLNKLLTFLLLRQETVQVSVFKCSGTRTVLCKNTFYTL